MFAISGIFTTQVSRTLIRVHQFLRGELLKHADGEDVFVSPQDCRKQMVAIEISAARTEPASGWRIYNINVFGVWLIETYRNQFAPEINAKGIEGLIEALSRRNQTNANKI